MESVLKQDDWHGLDMIAFFLDVSAGTLSASLDQLQNLESVKTKPYLLDDEIIKRILALHNKESDTTEFFLAQCKQWRKQNPNPEQLLDIDKVEQINIRIKKTNEQLFFLANHYKDHTIDKILQKDDVELAIDYLLGKLYNPLDADNSPRAAPMGPDSSYDFAIFYNSNNTEIAKLYAIKPENKLYIKEPLEKLYELYVKNRLTFGDFRNEFYEEGMDEIEIISKELGNYDPIEEMPVIQNDPEMGIFVDYLSLYRFKNGKRFIDNWLASNPGAINADNNQVVNAYLKAQFKLLRIDKNLTNGGIKVVDMMSHKSGLLIDKALWTSKMQGCFLIGSFLDMGDYLMTSGSAIPLNGRASAGKAVLSIIISHFKHFRGPGAPHTLAIANAVRETYGFCLRNGALTHMTTNESF